jgi:integrase
MATITKRAGKYLVQIRRTGHPSCNKTFTHRKDAETWARQKELAIERGDLPADHRSKLKGLTLASLIDAYLQKVTATKKGKGPERYFLSAFQRHPIASKPIADVTTEDFAKYRDERLAEVQPQTVKRQLAVIHHLYEIARDEWKHPLKENPLDKLALNAPVVRRDRRLQDGELELILEDARRRKNPLIYPIIQFAIELGMRRSEILAMRWRHLDLRNRILSIPDSKNGQPRKLPLTYKAMEILEGIDPVSDTVFAISANALNIAWQRMAKRLGLDDLHFHDFRHEAISTLFERGLSTPDVASISGHKDWRMLAVYTNPKPQDILKKLNRENTVAA